MLKFGEFRHRNFVIRRSPPVTNFRVLQLVFGVLCRDVVALCVSLLLDRLRGGLAVSVHNQDGFDIRDEERGKVQSRQASGERRRKW